VIFAFTQQNGGARMKNRDRAVKKPKWWNKTALDAIKMITAEKENAQSVEEDSLCRRGPIQLTRLDSPIQHLDSKPVDRR